MTQRLHSPSFLEGFMSEVFPLQVLLEILVSTSLIFNGQWSFLELPQQILLQAVSFCRYQYKFNPFGKCKQQGWWGWDQCQFNAATQLLYQLISYELWKEWRRMHPSMQDVLKHSQDIEANIIIADDTGCQTCHLDSPFCWPVEEKNPFGVKKFILHFSFQYFELSFSWFLCLSQSYAEWCSAYCKYGSWNCPFSFGTFVNFLIFISVGNDQNCIQPGFTEENCKKLCKLAVNLTDCTNLTWKP